MWYAPKTGRSGTSSSPASSTDGGWQWTTASTSGRARSTSAWIGSSLGTAHSPSSAPVSVQIDLADVVRSA